jgi:chromosome segregation protein
LYLKKLEIYGFKSFPERTELRFDPGITAIVGPNGSGKSNIADAVRWVLGEQSPKSLRGNRMEDIIFNGTEKRKPLGFAEVSLTLDNSKGDLPIDYSEVTITRRVFRSGESEYYINRTACRLKDIIGLFMDTGVGKEGYSIIGQGRIDEILSTKSEDRRFIFEEAAGVVKYRARKEEAQKKLEHTKQNLQRLDDIIEELSQQLEPLREQSEKAKAYLKYKEHLKELEINLFLCQYEKAKKQLGNLSQVLKGNQDEFRLKSSRLNEIESFDQQDEKAVARLEDELGKLQDTTIGFTGKIEQMEGETKVLKERIQFLKQDDKRVIFELQHHEEELKRLDIERDEISHRIKQTAVEKEKYQGRLAKLQTELGELLQRIRHDEDVLERSKGDIIDALNQLSNIKSDISRYHAMGGNVEKRLDEIVQTKAGILRDLEELRRIQDQTKKEISSIEERKAKLLDEKQDLEKQAKEDLQKLKELEIEIQEYKEDIDKISSRLHMLKEMQKDYDGFQTSVKSLLKDSEENDFLRSKICGVVAQLVNVPHELEKAIEAALGGALQYIVTNTEEDAKALIEHLRNKRYGRATFLPLSAIKSRMLNREEKTNVNMLGVIGVASELVEFNERYRKVFENLLGRTVIVKDMETGIAVARRSGHRFRIVTLEGDMINPGGSMTGGSLHSKYSSLLGRDREIKEAEHHLIRLNNSYKDVISSYDRVRLHKKQAEDSLAVLEKKFHGLEILLAKAYDHYNRTEKDIEDKRDQDERIERERNRLHQDMQDIQKEINALEEEQKRLEEGNSLIQKSILQSQDSMRELNDRRDKLSGEITQIKIRIASLEKEYANHQNALHRVNDQRNKLLEELSQKKEKIKANEKAVLELEEQIQLQTGSIQELRQKLSVNIDSIKKKEEEKERLQKKRREWDQEKRALQRELQDITERRHRLEMQVSRIESELENIQSKIWEEYELSYLHALSYRSSSFEPNHAVKNIEKLKKQIRDLGVINVNSIEDYKNVMGRYDHLNIQKVDLLQAKANLEDAIIKLTQKMKEQFYEEFSKINQNFNEVFRQIFGGGKAALVLQDEENVLECGIDIIAQPPGKKLQNLSLLSGGEKALTAIAILFSILKLKPTPFCILDEIEAALDETNVYQFTRYLRQYTRNTQFIVITHRKGTMEAGDTLYGVTMEEKGVSSLVSVRLEEKVS